jgi:hypothetical protein
MWEALNLIVKKNITALHPHALRHSFATHHLSAGSSWRKLKPCGHQNFNTTLIYAEIPTEELRHRVNAVTASPLAMVQKIIFVPGQILGQLINIDFNESYFTVGRNRIDEPKPKRKPNINTLVIGSVR